jgi:hypothetical protein
LNTAPWPWSANVAGDFPARRFAIPPIRIGRAKSTRISKGRGGMVITGEITMKQQFESEEAKKLKEKTDSDVATEKRINQLADKAAEKASKTEQRYDKNHTIISK